IQITEADIAELLQAKAAIQAGWTTLCECAGISPDSLRHVFVAGGFGYHLTPSHARAIGLLPPVPPDRIHLVGNASLAGATLALLTEKALPRMKSLRTSVNLVELNQIESFEDHYIDSLGLEYVSCQSVCTPE
ncbi:MAG: ASKHA domain-containing protein, partial [Kiritimatiellia bacterium]